MSRAFLGAGSFVLALAADNVAWLVGDGTDARAGSAGTASGSSTSTKTEADGDAKDLATSLFWLLLSLAGLFILCKVC